MNTETIKVVKINLYNNILFELLELKIKDKKPDTAKANGRYKNSVLKKPKIIKAKKEETIRITRL